jgi:hypothetical protein
MGITVHTLAAGSTQMELLLSLRVRLICQTRLPAEMSLN